VCVSVFPSVSVYVSVPLCVFVSVCLFGCAVCPMSECVFVLMPEQQKCMSTQVSLKAKAFPNVCVCVYCVSVCLAM